MCKILTPVFLVAYLCETFRVLLSDVFFFRMFFFSIRLYFERYCAVSHPLYVCLYTHTYSRIDDQQRQRLFCIRAFSLLAPLSFSLCLFLFSSCLPRYFFYFPFSPTTLFLFAALHKLSCCFLFSSLPLSLSRFSS